METSSFSDRILKWLDAIVNGPVLNNPIVNEAASIALVIFLIWFVIAWTFLPLILYRKLNRITAILADISAKLPPK